MPRIYTEAAYKADNLLLADAYNKPLQTAIEQLNGQLDGHNLPLRSIGEDKVVQQYIEETTTELSSYGTFNDFHTIKPIETSATFSGALGKGSQWNAIPGLFMQRNLTAGMINGSVCITVERAVVIDAVTSAEFGKESTYEVGVFLNDILIAETGEVGVGIFTIDLPFAHEVDSKQYVIDVRIWSNNRPTSAVNDHLSLEVTSRHLWFRNQKR